MTVIQVKAAHFTAYTVYTEVRLRYGKRELSDPAAVTIASWHQSPGLGGRAFAALASGAPIEHRAVLGDIEWAGREVTERADLRALDMLRDWTMARAREIEA